MKDIINTHTGRIRGGVKRLREARSRFDQRLDEIEQDDMLDQRQREVLLRRARGELEAMFEETLGKLRRAEAEGREARARFRVVGGIVDEMAAARVGRLLADGVPLAQIAQQARRIGDAEMLVACWKELSYAHDGRSFADMEGTQASIERALALMNGGAHNPDEFKALVDFEKALGGVEPEVAFTSATIEGKASGLARLSYAHATGQTGGGDGS